VSIRRKVGTRSGPQFSHDGGNGVDQYSDEETLPPAGAMPMDRPQRDSSVIGRMSGVKCRCLAQVGGNGGSPISATNELAQWSCRILRAVPGPPHTVMVA
jgi:hypothetical protein